MSLSSLLDRRPGLVILLGLAVLLALDQQSSKLNLLETVSENLKVYIKEHSSDVGVLSKTLVRFAEFLNKLSDSLIGQERLLMIAVGSTIPYYSSSSPLSFFVGVMYLLVAYFSTLSSISLLAITFALLLLYSTDGYAGKILIIGSLVFYYIISVEDFIDIVNSYKF